ncbi:MAG TPA: hypothetical protein DEP66_07185 [Acidimicrobiaceae bacterium]|nr:hypothetical protein [Acidimicrobiaceae bacterium]HCB37963.1 hypothetical protein [Acidimicrobiaceae bacterium]
MVPPATLPATLRPRYARGAQTCTVRAASLLRPSEVATIAVTYFTLGISTSVVHTTDGTEPWLVMAAALIVNSATATLAFAAITAGGGGFAAGVAGGWLVSTRFGVLAAAVAPRLWPRRSARAAAAFVAFDPNVALALLEPPDSGTSRRVYVVVAAALVLPWWAGTAVGVLIGEHLGDPGALGVDAVFPALFVAIVRPQLQGRRVVAIALAAAVVAVATVEVLPGGLPVLLAALTALWALLPAADRKPGC